MNSFDVFDTLIARRYINNAPILNLMERELGVVGFANYRTVADTGNRSIHQIYQSLVDSGVLTPGQASAALDREFELEKEHSYAVSENVSKVNHGDLLITDMYLSGPMVRELVRSAGIDKQVTIYQSNGDKRTGAVWDRLKHLQFLHTGDNEVSDVATAQARGIATHWYPGTALTSNETYIYNAGMHHVALLMREIRLSTKPTHTTPEFLNLSAGVVVPLIALMSEWLHRTYPGKHIVFLGRDCQLLHRYYSSYYSTNSSYVPFSRKVAFSDGQLAAEYLSIHCPTDSVLFDLNSTGATWEHISKYMEVNIAVAIYLDKQTYTGTIPVPPKHFNYITENNAVRVNGMLFEMLNAADHGTVERLEKLAEGVIVGHFGVPELDAAVICDLQSPVNKAVSVVGAYKSGIRAEMSKLDVAKLSAVFGSTIVYMNTHSSVLQQADKLMQTERSYMTEVAAARNIEHPLTVLANTYKSDKGSTYKCAHRYTDHYKDIFEPYKNTPFTMLEIGLNRDNTADIPSLRMYKEYFSSVVLYGFDIDVGFKKFDNPEQGINIIIGDQSDPSCLNQFDSITFDLIIDDGYHASKHQQISLSELWDRVVPGGVYVIEDLHYQPDPSIETSITTKEMLRAWNRGDVIGTQWMPVERAKEIMAGVSHIDMFNSKSRLWPESSTQDALIVLHKKIDN